MNNEFKRMLKEVVAYLNELSGTIMEELRPIFRILTRNFPDHEA
jgi:hypothetical protein